MLYPDNPNRQQRLKNLGSQLEMCVSKTLELSEQIQPLSASIKEKLKLFKDMVKKITQMTEYKPPPNLIKRLKQLIAKIDNLQESIPINQADSHWSFYTFRFVTDLVAGSIVGKKASNIIEKYVSNLYLNKFAKQLGQEAGSKTLRKLFMTSVPKFLQKWNIFGKAGGAVAGGVIGYAIDTIISAITGAILRDSLQEMTRQVLDYRFRGDKNLKVMEVIIEGLKAIDNQIIGGMGTLKMANDAMEKGQVDLAYMALSYLELDKTIDLVNKDKQVSDSQIVDILVKRDEGRYRDPEVENGWKPLTQEQFELKYPPEKE